MTHTRAIARAVELVNYQVRQSQETLDDFRTGAAKSITHAMTWKGEAAMTAERVLGLACKVCDLLLSIDSGERLAECRTILTEMADVAAEDLVATEDWIEADHNSTSAISNIENLCKCDADRAIIALCRGLLDVLAKDDATYEAEDAERAAKRAMELCLVAARQLVIEESRNMRVGSERVTRSPDIQPGTYPVNIGKKQFALRVGPGGYGTLRRMA